MEATMFMQTMMEATMFIQTMMEVIMLVQAMTQAMGDGGVCDITSLFNDEFHKDRPWVCSDIACESPLLAFNKIFTSSQVPSLMS